MPVVVLEQEAEATKQRSKDMKREVNAEPPSSQRYARKPKPHPRRGRKFALTTPDLVLLSLLAERPMHGYQANLELERREIRDWAGISRPQVYYSLEKLARAGLVRNLETNEPAAGPERSTFETTEMGLTALADALEREEWTTQRDYPPFLTWLALSWQARPGTFEKQMERRREFLEQELAREKATLKSILEEVGHPYHEAVWMVSLMIEQCKLELRWLRKLRRELRRRAAAQRPSYAPGLSS
jgi:DNA-binding PadR family transcriptional regulator